MLRLDKYSVGVGDRFGHQAKAQLRAFFQLAAQGVDAVPVWNKSYREHTTLGSEPNSVRAAADAAVQALGWDRSFHVDADHIRLETVDGFLDSSDFFTLDVADAIGQRATGESLTAFTERYRTLLGRVSIPGIEAAFEMTHVDLERIAGQYLRAVQEAGRLYRHILESKGDAGFITEVSMDETDSPQTPGELLVILAALADEGIPVQTIAPKFTGRFNKGVDYVGDVTQFEREFREDLAVIAYAVGKFGLPENLKLSVHSGSDKFSLYAPIRQALADTGAGLHLKTAGTTWLEEVIGLAEAGGDGLLMAQEIYAQAYVKREALCAPYAAVIAIDADALPAPETVRGWTAAQFVGAVRHDQTDPLFNPSVRQLLHVGYKIAGQMGDRYLQMLDACEPTIAHNVTENLYVRHLKPLFLG